MTEGERQGVDHPHLGEAEHREEPEREGEEAGRRGGSDEHTALVEPVDEHTTPGAEQEHWCELERECEPDRDTALGQAEHEPRLGDELEPGAGAGDDLAEEVQAEVAGPQRTEGSPSGAGHGCHGDDSRSRSRIAAASASVARSAGSSASSRRAR